MNAADDQYASTAGGVHHRFYRTVGDMSCTGAVESDASSIDAVLAEISTSTLTERGATRADDRLSESAMEDRKKEGYF